MARTEITKKELKRTTKILSCQSTVNFLFCPFAWNAISAALHSGMLNLNNQISLLIIAIMCTFHLTSFHIKKIISTLLIFIALTALSTLLVNWTRVFFHFSSWRGKKIEFFLVNYIKLGDTIFHGSNLISFFSLALLAVDAIVTDA